MQLTDEQILKHAEDLSERFEPLNGDVWFSFFKAELLAFARQILLDVQQHSSTQLPLPQAAVMRPLAGSADKCLQCGWDIEDCTCPDGYNGAGANGA